ncbi:hypothetical protein HRV97_13230 [Sphingomonas sp. HHU CXW]|uniref:Uncharacterized protein n=1 Tax=Sphingomonas hominis TaxID=2741495 RepID=A0ABX2JKD2_9SPHN|nr:hypothetical protein [Sphingomonas hominis]
MEGGASAPPVPPREAQAASIRPAGAATAATDDAGLAPAAWRLRDRRALRHGHLPSCGRRRVGYATLILHASAASVGAAHRRVLQVNYAAADPPGGLAYLAI